MPHKANTMNCQPRSCGRLAPSSAITGQKLLAAATNRSGAIQDCGGSTQSVATASSVKPIDSKLTSDQIHTAVSVVPASRRRRHSSAETPTSNSVIATEAAMAGEMVAAKTMAK